MRYLDRINNPDHTPLEWLTTHLLEATSLHAVVGYLDWAGVRLIEDPLRDMLERGGQVHIVVDARGDRPRPADLTRILELFAPHGDRATVTLIADPAPLHAKVFLLDTPAGRRALVGSANFTAAGLGTNLEACVELEPHDTQPLTDIADAVSRWRTHPSARTADLATLEGTTEPNRPSRLKDILWGAVDGSTRASRILTGYTDFDLLVDGLDPGQLVVVAGRPGTGKTIVGLDWLRSAAIHHNTPAMLVTFSSSRTDVVQRMVSAETGIPLSLIREKGIEEYATAAVAIRMEEISQAPLHIQDSCSSSLRQVAGEVRRAALEDGVRLVVIDPVQMLRMDRRVDPRLEMVEVGRELKRLALELQVVIVAVSQLPYGGEACLRAPKPWEVRDGGLLEQDADVLVLLHRDDQYNHDSALPGEVDLIVVKNRNEMPCYLHLAAQLHLSRFVDMAT